MTNQRLLIVEDHEPTRRILGTLFRRMGLVVDEAGTVAEGLASLSPDTDCAVIDLQLPDGYGSEIVERVRDARLPTKVVICTGCGDDDWMDRVRALGPEAVLEKPVDFRQVCDYCGLS